MSSFLKGLNNLTTTCISCYSLYSPQVGSLAAQEPFMFMFTFRPFSGCTLYPDLLWPPPSPCQITLKFITSKCILFVPQISILPCVHYLLVYICVKSQHSNWMRLFQGSAHVCTFLQPLPNTYYWHFILSVCISLFELGLEKQVAGRSSR